MFSKDLNCRHVKTRACLGKAYTMSTARQTSLHKIDGNQGCNKDITKGMGWTWGKKDKILQIQVKVMYFLQHNKTLTN